MSCIFCNSFYHLSQYCDINVSAKSRKRILKSKLLCLQCMADNCVATTNNFRVSCKPKCCICYKKNHHAVFCPDRFTAPKLFIPNIDHYLLQRFLAFFDPYEKILLACQSPAIYNQCQPQDLQSVNLLNTYTFNSPREPEIVICKETDVCGDDNPSSRIFSSLHNQKIITDYIRFTNIIISPLDIFNLLSSNTKVLILKLVKLSSKITMDEIFQRAPNLEEFEYDTSFDEDSWQADNFFKGDYGRKLKIFKLTLSYDADFWRLMDILRKNRTNVKIELFYTNTSTILFGKKHLDNKISTFFDPAESKNNSSFAVYIRKTSDRYKFVNSYVLKSDFS